MSANSKQVGGTHYQTSIQPWEAMQAWMTDEEFQGFLRGNVIKYIARASDLTLAGKGGVQDLEKAHHYLEKLIEFANEA